MKIQFRDIENFVRAPDKAARVILIYGPDQGLMKERSSIIGKTVVPDLSDPFNVINLSCDGLNDDPARLSDEANAISMMGGDRLIRVDDATDKITSLVKSYLENPSDNALIILHAGELSPRSSLRKLCESAKNAAALPCYVEDERDLARTIREMVQAENHQIAPDAVTWLAANISGDRGKVRSEMEKLLIYKGAETTPISLVDVQTACGQAGMSSMDSLVFDVAGRNAKNALKTFQGLTEEGVQPIAILRALQNHFRRLHISKARIEEGEEPQMAIKKLSPPIFFKFQKPFQAQVQNWSLPALTSVLARLNSLEGDTKQTGSIPETLCAQAILALSARGRR